MIAHHASNTSRPASLRADVLLVLLLIGLGVAARLLPHAMNFSPIVASALFAGAVLHRRFLALLVPIGAMLLSDLVLGFDDWRITAVVYAAIALPAAIGMLARRYRPSRMVVPAALACSLIFFATSNFAVWAFGGLYSLDMAGLAACYVAALPFLKYTVAGDLFWAVVLFGGAWLVQRASARARGGAAVAARP